MLFRVFRIFIKSNNVLGMKKIFLQSILFVSAAMVGLLTGCTSETKSETLSVSDAQITLLGDGSETQSVTILNAPGAVEVEALADWVKVSEIVDNVFTVSADPNDMGSERSTRIMLTSGKTSAEISVRQLAVDELGVHYRYMNDYRFAAMSPGGRYIGAVREEFTSDGEQGFIPAFLDTETGELTELPIIRTSACNIQGFSTVTDDGKMFVFNANNTNSGIIDIEGNLTFPEEIKDSGLDMDGRRPVVSAVSTDGSIWVGYQFRNVGGYIYRPVVFENGTPRLLPMPETDSNGNDWTVNGAGMIACGCSADGKIIYGTEFGEFLCMVYWTAEDNYSTPRWVSQENSFFCANDNTCISPNGEWLAGLTGTADAYSGGFYNLKEQKFYPADGTPIGVTDDGFGFTTGAQVVDIVNNTSRSAASWIQDNYGISISSGSIEYMTADGRCLMGSRTEMGGIGELIFRWFIYKDAE